MGRQLLVVRHAKAAQGSPDIARALTDHGRADAREIGRWLHAHDAIPDTAIVSPATRTMQTWEAAASMLRPATPRVVLDARIWANGVAELLDAIADQPDEIATIAVVGHNPSIHALAARLAAGAGGIEEFPTATVAQFRVNAW